jgi:hypothetical protein
MHWPQQLEDICRIVKSQTSIFKIVLKTKNETDLLENWFEHHLSIVGDLNIIVFDNGSTNKRTLEIYKKYRAKINLFGFHENHNLVHNTTYFSQFYQALRESSKFYTFIDADEFLYFTDGDSCIPDQEFITVLKNASDETTFFGLWAANVPGNKDIFYISNSSNTYTSNLKGGKPIISSKFDVKGFINHNIQLYENNSFIKPSGGVLVCHLNMFDKNRREMINIEKILAHKFVKNISDIDNIISDNDLSGLSGPVLVYIKEIIKCRTENWTPIEHPMLGCFKIHQDRSIEFSDEKSHKVLMDFKNNCGVHWHNITEV